MSRVLARCYPDDLPLAFDKHDWIRRCGLVPDAPVASGKPMVIAPPPTEHFAQAPANGARRVGLLSSTTAKVDGVDDELDVDIAILDTGLDLDHPELDVRGGVNCTTAKSFADDGGHGTMVAGFAAAIDNAIGRVGIAPGARLWSVKVLNKVGNGSISQIICGIDWVTANAATIDVANMSLSGVFKNADAGDCGLAEKKRDADVMHQAICGAVGAGVTVVAAAGNDSEDADTRGPASYDEVITVWAITDLDGQPGGLQPPTGVCSSELNEFRPIADDTFAFFSNFGADIDISAPGVCMNTTLPDDNYGTGSGTSFAAPLVAGAAALLLVNDPGATPADVRNALLAMAEPGPIVGDPDAFAEGILNVSGL